jgi:peptidyl-prolyl cis-trans isomerase D
MLDVFRENLRSLKWLLWVVAAAMVLYLGDFFFGSSSGGGPGATPDAAAWAAKVYGEAIPSELLFNMTRNLDAQYRQLFGDSYQQMRGQLRLGTTAANQLVERKLILDEARRLGLVVAPEEVAQAIQDDPAFKDDTGQFIGAERYRQLFERRGGVAAFEQALAEELLIQRWERMLGESVDVSDAEVEAQYRERNDKTSIDYVVVRSMDQQIDMSVSDEAIAASYAAHPERYPRTSGGAYATWRSSARRCATRCRSPTTTCGAATRRVGPTSSTGSSVARATSCCA